MIPLLVAFAGGLGAVTRFVVDGEVHRRFSSVGTPLGTAFVNVTGSFLLGLAAGWWVVHAGDPGLKAVLGVGFLGGYTTFSTASVEAARLAAGGRGLTAVVHAAAMLVFSVFFAALGFWIWTF